MPAAPPIHLALMQPPGLTDALRLLDPALALRARLARRGIGASVAKNRLVYEAVNLVFGAHHEFDPALRARWCCVIVNLEPLGPGAPPLDPAYLALLQSGPVLDCDPAYFADPSTAPLLMLADDPALRREPLPPATTRRFDVLLPGRLGPRGRALAEALAAAGLAIATPDMVLIGPERAALLRESRAVLLPAEPDAVRLDPVLAVALLSHGVPVVAERVAGLGVLPQLEDAIEWCRPEDTVRWLVDRVRTAEFASAGAARLEAFAAHDPAAADTRLLEGLAALWREHLARRDVARWRPPRIHLGSGRDYLPGWFNVDVIERAEPDALLDLGRPLSLPLVLESRYAGPVELVPGSVERIYASNVLEHIPDLALALTQMLALLRVGGELEVEVPHERSPGAWQDPTHVRAMNENSWLYPTTWFWYLGWFTHRFELAELSYVDLEQSPCAREQAHFMRVRLVKVETTAAERAFARSMQPDFGGLLPPETR